MGTKACDILFQGDEEDYSGDPIRILDFEERTVFWGSEKYLKNFTIEDPGYVVNISPEDCEVRLGKSLSQIKESKNPSKTSGYANKYGNLLSECRTCSIKLVDCHKFPWFYQNKLGSVNNNQSSDTKHNVIEIKEEKEREEIIIIDLTEKEHVEYNNINKEEIAEVVTDGNTFTSIDNTLGGTVRKEKYKTLSKPVLNHPKVPINKADQDSDLVISAYTRTIDEAMKNLISNIESRQNNINLSNNLSNQLLLGRKSLKKNRVNFSQDTKPKYNMYNDCKGANHKKKDSKGSDKIKHIYTSEQISKTKLKIKKCLSKSKQINYNKEIEHKVCYYNINKNNMKQNEYLKPLTNKNKQNNCENKQERIQTNSYSDPLLSFPELTKLITETGNSASFPNRNIDPDKIQECNKKIFREDRIIPHFHQNICLKRPDILSKTKTNTNRLKDSEKVIHNYVTKKYINPLDFTKDLYMKPVVPQILNHSIHQTIHCIENNNALANINKLQNKISNTNVNISNISALHSVNQSHDTYKVPVNNEMILNRSQLSPDVIIKNENKTVFMRQSKEVAAQLEEERLRYLLPSNCYLPNSRIQNIFS